MSKITLAYPIEKIQGKVNKQDSTYFNCRNGRTYMKRIVNPYKGDPTTTQLEAQDRFKTATSNARKVMKDKTGEAYKAYEAEWKTGSTGCVTLYGYIVQQEFAKLA